MQWTFWEYVMARLWATNKVPYATNEEILADAKLMALNLAFVFIIPMWRDIHFYIAHRFIHIRAIYKYVHSLHHRNADPEPFSGMTMHPIEHLYYFSNVFVPCLYLDGLSPLIFLWCFTHLTIAPGAGHSGFEDNFQADQYHYVHHAKFECNYGSPFPRSLINSLARLGKSLERAKRTLGSGRRSSIKKRRMKKKKKNKPWSPNGYLGMPKDRYHGIYTVFWMALGAIAYWGSVGNHDDKGRLQVRAFKGIAIERLVAATVAYGPVFAALAVAWASGDRMSWRWPFHKERIIGAFGLFILLGFFACLLPVYHATLWISAPIVD